MSARYSSSPVLRLQIGKSRLRAALHAALCCAAVYALWSIGTRGYPLLALLLTPLSVVQLWRLRHDRMIGTELCWRQGCWLLQQGTRQQVIEPTARSIATRWVVYLAFRDVRSGRAGQLWLYADSTSTAQLRRLRVRVALL